MWHKKEVVAISEDHFAEYVFEVMDKLERSENLERHGMPTYFRFMTLVALHYFMSKDVRVAILEVGVGGEYDSTNIIVKPLAVGITTIHLDHQSQLGDTLPKIAWHKAGILKEEAFAFTVTQENAVFEVIAQRAKAARVGVITVQDLPWLATDPIASKGYLQNATMASHLALAVLERLPGSEVVQQVVDLKSPDEFTSSLLLEGLKRSRLPARGEVHHAKEATYYFDGAHTVESVDLAVLTFRKKFFETDTGRLNPSEEASRRQVFRSRCFIVQSHIKRRA
jgi:folylpolyglutamate synthase